MAIVCNELNRIQDKSHLDRSSPRTQHGSTVNLFRLESWTDWLQLILQLGMSDGFWYGLLAGATWLLCYVVFRRRWLRRKVVAHFPEPAEVWREIRYSLLTLLIFSLVGVATLAATRQGWTQIYG